MTVFRLERAAGEPLEERLPRLLKRLGQRLTASARRVRRHADDEAIHDLRVAARRLAAALSLWRDQLRGRPRRRGMRMLRKLRRAIGAARESEVHLDELRKRAPEAETVQAIARELAGEVERGRRRAARRAAGSRVRRILRRVARAAPPGQPTATPALAQADAQRRLARVATRGRESLVHALETTDEEALHEARIAVKKWRYALEAFEACSGGSHPRVLDDLRALQDTLGTIQDRATLRDRLAAHTAALIERGDGEEATSLKPLLVTLESERQHAVERFRELAAALPTRV